MLPPHYVRCWTSRRARSVNNNENAPLSYQFRAVRSEQVTVINPPFLKLLNKYEPGGVISTLSQEVFADIKVTSNNITPIKAF